MTQVDLIKEMLASEDSADREFGLEKLNKLGAVIPLVQLDGLSRDPESHVRMAFLEMLPVYGSRAVLHYAMLALQDSSGLREEDPDPDEDPNLGENLVRITAAEILSDSPQDVATLEALKVYLDDEDEILRRCIASIYGKSELPQYADYLEEKLLEEKSDQTRAGYYGALFNLGNKSRLDDLIGLLQAENYRERCLAANMLENLFDSTNDPKVCSAIHDALETEESGGPRSSMREALFNILAAPKLS